MHIYRTSLYLFRVFFDVVLIIAAFIVSAIVSLPGFSFFDQTNAEFLLLCLLGVWFFSSRTTGLYDEFRSRNYSYELLLIVKNICAQVVSAIIILFLIKESELSRFFVLIYSGLLLILLGLSKYLVRRLLIAFRMKGRNIRKLLIIGAGEVGRDFYELSLKNPHFGYKIIGFLDDKSKTFLNGQYLGKINELEKVLNEKSVDDVIIALPNYASAKLEEVIRTCEKHTTRIRIIPDYFKFVSAKYNISMFGQFPVISVRGDRINEFHWRVLKRGFDFVFTISLFILLFSWLFPIIIVIQKLLNPGPIFYKAKRWGRKNKEFVCYKFRSMVSSRNESSVNAKHNHTSKTDPRITRFGKFLRRTNIDELPQFWNVLKGEMSIVGPRPHDVLENEELKDRLKLYMYRHIVKPGVTGWAQVNGYRGGTDNLELMQKRTDYDVWYIENWSFELDMQIIALTVWNMLKGDENAY